MHETNFTFYHDPYFLDGAKIEKDNDLDERWLEKKVQYMTSPGSNDRLQVVFLDMTTEEWNQLGLRRSLWGQARAVNGKVICYGRWHENSSYDQSQHFPAPLDGLTELALGLAHEMCHGGYHLRGKKDLTHYHFYGLETPDGDERYERTPTPQQAIEDILRPGQKVDFFCIRTQGMTERWKDEIRSVESVINHELGTAYYQLIPLLKKQVERLAAKINRN